MIEKPSGVNEKIPLNASSTFESPSAGINSAAADQAGAKSSSVNGSIDGIGSPAESAISVDMSTGIGRWL